jgi:two-component system, chemotaxis family, chemotaxis protein CheY
MKILVVDDEPVSRMKMKRIMSNFGICIALNNGSSAVSTFQKALGYREPFDIVTLDISMPDMDGMEVLARFRQIEVGFKIPKEEQAVILMVTGESDQATVLESIELGCNDYVSKPFKKEIITEKLRKLGFDL